MDDLNSDKELLKKYKWLVDELKKSRITAENPRLSKIIWDQILVQRYLRQLNYFRWQGLFSENYNPDAVGHIMYELNVDYK